MPCLAAHLGGLLPAVCAPLRLSAAQREHGPVLISRPSATTGRSLGNPGQNGEGWAVRDVEGRPATQLLLRTGLDPKLDASGGAGLLGSMPDARLLGADSDESGILLLLSTKVLRLACLPAARRTGGAAPMVAVGDESSLFKKVGAAFDQYEAAHREGWHLATDLGARLEDDPELRSAAGTARSWFT